MRKIHYSFKPGLQQLKVSDVPKAKEELKKVLPSRSGMAHEETLRRRSIDWPNIPLCMIKAINEVFEKFNVPPEKVWNEWQTE